MLHYDRMYRSVFTHGSHEDAVTSLILGSGLPLELAYDPDAEFLVDATLFTCFGIMAEDLAAFDDLERWGQRSSMKRNAATLAFLAWAHCFLGREMALEEAVERFTTALGQTGWTSFFAASRAPEQFNDRLGRVLIPVITKQVVDRFTPARQFAALN